MRPFGIASLIAGFDLDMKDGKMKPVLYQSDPAGTHSRWNAQVIGGKNDKSLREFLEKNYVHDMEEKMAIKLGIQALLEVVDSGAKNMEICLVKEDESITMTEEEVDVLVKEIEQELEEAKLKKGAATAAMVETGTE